VKHTCPTCGNVFHGRSRRRYCSRKCLPRVRPLIKPRRGALAQDLERTCVHVGHNIARERAVPFVELFSGSDAARCKRIVYKRVLRLRSGIEPAAVSAAINATLVVG
jgi:hypothetical protein